MTVLTARPRHIEDLPQLLHTTYRHLLETLGVEKHDAEVLAFQTDDIITQAVVKLGDRWVVVWTDGFHDGLNEYTTLETALIEFCSELLGRNTGVDSVEVVR